MASRHAVLLTPSESLGPAQLLSYKQEAPVSPLFAALAKSVHLVDTTPLSRPLFSYTCALFCTPQNLNSRLFKQFRTLRQKHPGWGAGDVLLTSPRRTASVAHPFRGEASPSQVVRVTTHQLQITTHVVLPNRPHRPYHRFRTPSPIMSPLPIPGLNPVYEDYARC